MEGNKLLLRWKDNLDKFAENNLGLIFNRFQVHYIRRTLSSWSVAYFKWVIITECDYWIGSCVSDVFLVVLMCTVRLVGLTRLVGLQLSDFSGERLHGRFTHRTWVVISFQKQGGKIVKCYLRR